MNNPIGGYPLIEWQSSHTITRTACTGQFTAGLNLWPAGYFYLKTRLGKHAVSWNVKPKQIKGAFIAKKKRPSTMHRAQ